MSTGTGTAARALATIGATGVYGPRTQAAVAEFQRTYAITPSLGFTGPKTIARINALADYLPRTPVSTPAQTPRLVAPSTGTVCDLLTAPNQAIVSEER
jgi:peptidoglycan hydrolase-like protein with peptidoglycan-binding domain